MKTTPTSGIKTPADSKLLINIKLGALVIVTLFTMAIKSRGNEALEHPNVKAAFNSTFLSWVIFLI